MKPSERIYQPNLWHRNRGDLRESELLRVLDELDDRVADLEQPCPVREDGDTLHTRLSRLEALVCAPSGLVPQMSQLTADIDALRRYVASIQAQNASGEVSIGVPADPAAGGSADVDSASNFRGTWEIETTSEPRPGERVASVFDIPEELKALVRAVRAWNRPGSGQAEEDALVRADSCLVYLPDHLLRVCGIEER